MIIHQFGAVQYLIRFESIMSSLTYEQHEEIIDLVKRYGAIRASKFFAKYCKYAPYREMRRVGALDDLAEDVVNEIGEHGKMAERQQRQPLSASYMHDFNI